MHLTAGLKAKYANLLEKITPVQIYTPCANIIIHSFLQ